MQITTNLIVDAIEPCLAFWCDRLGFTKAAEFTQGDRLGFVILARDGAELMLQTQASVADDIAPAASVPSRAALYVRVDDLSRIKRALHDVERVIPDRRTFYGADEVIVNDPVGNLVVLAERAEPH